MEKIVDFMLNYYGATPYAVILAILLACGLGLPIPEDITLIAAGISSYYGTTDVWVMTLVCFFGVLVGDSIIFFLGAKYGRRLTKKWLFHKLLPDDRLDSVSKQFRKRGNRLVFAARFMPGLRAPIFFTAGVLHLPARVFLFYDGLAALLSVPTIVGTVYYFGDELDYIVRIVQKVEHGIIFVIVAVVGLILLKWYWTHRRLKKQA